MSLENANPFLSDVVICIDATATMKDYSAKVHNYIKSFFDAYRNKLRENGIASFDIRAKLILFRDYAGAEEPMVISDWLSLNKDNKEFYKRIENIEYAGGADYPENAFEALYYAFASDLRPIEGRGRQIFLLFTDADALPVGERRDCQGYPESLRSLEELANLYKGERKESMISNTRFSKRRLIAFTPLSSELAAFVYAFPGTMVEPFGNEGDDLDPEYALHTIMGGI